MGPTHVLLKLLMDEIDVPTDLNTFKNRFRLQKKVYLTQLTGFDIGYRFGWYLRGPYSRELTSDAFALKELLALDDKEHEEYHLGDAALSCVEQARPIWERPADVACSEDRWLELLASLHYLKHIAYWPAGSTKDSDVVFEQLVATKPHFAGQKRDAERAWKHLRDLGLIDAKTLGTA